MGIKVWLGNLFMDIHGGIGIGYRKNIHTGRKNTNDEWEYVFLEKSLYKEGVSIIPTFPFNIKLGVLFNSND